MNISRSLLITLLLAANLQNYATAEEKQTDSKTPAAAVAPEIPKSVFAPPATNSASRDPFFPNTTRFTVSTNSHRTVAPPPAIPLVLQGISGTPENRLAIINGKTVAAGESIEVTAGNQRIEIRCLEVNADSCLIENGTQQRVLRLRDGQ